MKRKNITQLLKYGAEFIAKIVVSKMLPVATLGAMGSGILIYFTKLEWLKDPFVIFVVVLGSSIAVMGLFFFIFYATHKFYIYKAQQKWLANEAQLVNPLERHYTKKRIDLTIFANPATNTIEKKTFNNCELIGKAVILIEDNCQYSNNSLNYCSGIVVVDNTASVSKILTTGSIVFLKNCSITNSKFFNCVIYAKADFFDNFKRIPSAFISSYSNANQLKVILENKSKASPYKLRNNLALNPEIDNKLLRNIDPKNINNP